MFFGLPSKSLELEVKYDAEVRSMETGSVQNVKAGEKTKIEEASVLISAEGFLPLLIIPQLNSTRSVSVNGVSAKPIIDKAVLEISNKKVSDLLVGVVSLQRLIEDKKVRDASSQVVQLKQKYEGITFLDFLHASILLLEGRKNEALIMAENALKKMPDYEEGKIFVERLKSGGFL